MACESVVEPRKELSPDFGNAVRHNMAVQIVNPEASTGITEAPTLDGNRANAAVTLYQTGKTKAVEAVRTSDVGQQ
jgi:type IV pilus biogenesis protein CpaD/CtpE